MKRNLIGTLSLVALSLLLSATSHAQAVAKADVPFAFTVAKKQLPSGNYTIMTNSRGLITVQSNETGASLIALARTELPRKNSPKLIFHRVGSQYFLSQVWGSEGTAGLTLPTSALEKEMQMASEASKAIDQVVIALK